jgi:hypothetical protein
MLIDDNIDPRKERCSSDYDRSGITDIGCTGIVDWRQTCGTFNRNRVIATITFREGSVGRRQRLGAVPFANTFHFDEVFAFIHAIDCVLSGCIYS